MHALLADRGFVGGVGGVNAGEEHRNRVRVQATSDGLEFGGSCCLCIAVRELRQAREDPLLCVLRLLCGLRHR